MPRSVPTTIRPSTIAGRAGHAGDRERPDLFPPAVADGLAFIDSEDHSVTALDAATGAVRWQSKLPGVDEIVPAVAGGTIYTAVNGGQALAVDGATGEVLWTLPIKGVPYGMAVTSGLVLVGTDLGVVYAIGGAHG